MRTIILLLLVVVLVVGCSTTKMDSENWTADTYIPTAQTRILVIANTDAIDLQREFENKMARALAKKGFKSLKMNELLPQIPYKQERSDEEIEQIVQLFKGKGIRTVVLASQKSVETKTVASKSSFKNYLNSIQPLKMEGTRESNLEYDMEDLVTYTLEAVVYQLSLPQGERAVASTTITAVNPNSEEEVQKRFLKEIEILFTEK